MLRTTFETKSRPHVGLEVEDLERSIAFYRALLGEEPVEVHADYARFEPAEPALNLSLILSDGPPGSPGSARPAARRASDHFGIQVRSSEVVREASRRLRRAGIGVRLEEQSWCCYAVQDKVWASDPDGNPWEVFVVLQAGVGRPPRGSREAGSREAGDREPGCCEPGCCAAG